jgi:succinyl-diaminopimelate desuccinylase
MESHRSLGYGSGVPAANSLPTLNPAADVVALTAALIDIPSTSHEEEAIASAVADALHGLPHLRVERDGNTVVASTDLGRAQRVILAGHLDTVPEHGNLPHHFDGDLLYGLGSCDMKGGVAVALRCAATIPEPVRDVTYVFYEAEEVEERFNGLRRLTLQRPDLISGDFAVLLEPSDAGIEAGCQGTLRAVVSTSGRRSHSARSWKGDNAIHKLGEILRRLNSYVPERVDVDGLTYREGLNAVGVAGGVAGNVIPDAASVTVNYRFAPSRSVEEAEAHVREVFEGFALEIVDLAPGARPGLGHPAAAAFVSAVGAEPRPKFGWTDVARFTALGIPAVNFGPGDPSLAHAQNEHVPLAQLQFCDQTMQRWLRG